ncbi:hypothetical protein DB346_02885 [Verrucomicrobia bacterium LW23]|nr:hypothetical protein DB346_03770 [Verrucomicrobia bacterium LW23]PTY04394.1 hypothetical protein DB346_02885 [Verrucomicrobia bacterium LW23]
MKINVYNALKSERTYQDAKWPNHLHTPGEWLLIIGKLQMDAQRAWLSKGNDGALHEIRQIGATCVAAMEQCGAPARPGQGFVGSLPDPMEALVTHIYQRISDTLRQQGYPALTGEQGVFVIQGLRGAVVMAQEEMISRMKRMAEGEAQ